MMQKITICAAALGALPLLATAAGGGARTGAGKGASSPATSARPNVLIILGDDIGFGDISLHGGKTPTPRIDALASQGVELTNFMVSPLSSPSRSMLLTSRHYLRTNQGPVTDGSMDPTELTIAKTFRAGGYGTGIFGKWHNSYDPQTPEFKAYLAARGVKSREKGICVLEYGFDTSWNYYGGGSDYNDRETFEGFVTWWNGYTHRPNDRGWTENMIADHAIEFMAASAKAGKPFFCYVACELLHAPYQPVWEDYLKVPDALIPTGGRMSREEFERLAHGDNTQPRDWPAEQLKAVYGAMIVAHNRNVGRLMDALDSLSLARNTIVVYFTDNGATAQGSNLPFKGGKHTTWEGGVHVPCMIRWPGHIPAGSKWDGLAGAMELMPTLAAMAGIPVPTESPAAGPARSTRQTAANALTGTQCRPLDGKNIWPALENAITGNSLGSKLKGIEYADVVTYSPVESYYWTLNDEDALRTAQWKARRSVDGFELYNIRTDVGEKDNIANLRPDVVRQLTAQMDAWVASTGVQLSHMPTKTDVGRAAPSGQVLEISVDLDRDARRRDDWLLVPFASWDGDHTSQDLLVVDVMVPRGAQPKGYRLTPLDLTGGEYIMFTARTGVDQYGHLAWEGQMPAAGVWERRAYGLSRNTPHQFNNIAMLVGGPKGRYTVYIDNLFVLHADGSRTVLWESGANKYDMQKWLRAPDGYRPFTQTAEQLTALPAGFSNLTVKAVELKDL